MKIWRKLWTRSRVPNINVICRFLIVKFLQDFHREIDWNLVFMYVLVYCSAELIFSYSTPILFIQYYDNCLLNFFFSIETYSSQVCTLKVQFRFQQWQFICSFLLFATNQSFKLVMWGSNVKNVFIYSSLFLFLILEWV